MKKFMISLLAAGSIATAGVGFTQIQPQTAHASIIGKVFMATYLYKNRDTVKEMFSAAKTKANSVGFPHFKAGATNGTMQEVSVVTKHHNVSLGEYPAKLVQMVSHADSDVKAELAKIL